MIELSFHLIGDELLMRGNQHVQLGAASTKFEERAISLTTLPS
jgi:hypothetical protein